MIKRFKGVFVMLQVVVTLLYVKPLFAQDMVVQDARLAIDDALKVALASSSLVHSLHSGGQLNFRHKQFTYVVDKDNAHYLLDYLGNKYALFMTTFPLIQFHLDGVIVNEPKRISQFTYADTDTIIKAYAGIELRGSSTLAYPKKNYDINLYQSKDGLKNLDVSLNGMRKDDDWILDAIYNEPLRLRSHLSFELWKAIGRLPYQDKEPGASVGIATSFADVFINDRYMGVFLLTEQVDRKLLKLKKRKDDTVRGELFQAARYLGASSFDSIPKKNNFFASWGGYDIKYPTPNERPWDHLYAFTDFVLNADEAQFSEGVGAQFDLDNLIDYFIFINVLRAPDNLGKNLFVARYDLSSPYFYTPWDLDGVFGNIYSGEKGYKWDDFLTNGLLRRVMEVNPDGFNKRFQERWLALRKTVLSTENILARIDALHQSVMQSGVYQRETHRWPDFNYEEEDVTYMREWTVKRLQFLDGYVSGLTEN